MSNDEMWEALLALGVSEQTLQIVTSINGYSQQTMLDVLYAHTGLRSFEQVDGTENEDYPYDEHYIGDAYYSGTGELIGDESYERYLNSH